MSYKQIINIPNATKVIVNGWIREICSKYSSTLSTVPFNINLLCILYYCAADFFEYVGDLLQVSLHKNIITGVVCSKYDYLKSSKDEYKYEEAWCVYGYNKIPSTHSKCYEWLIRLNKTSKYAFVSMGVVAFEKNNNYPINVYCYSQSGHFQDYKLNVIMNRNISPYGNESETIKILLNEYNELIFLKNNTSSSSTKHQNFNQSLTTVLGTKHSLVSATNVYYQLFIKVKPLKVPENKEKRMQQINIEIKDYCTK